MSRPDALGGTVTIGSLDDVDLALAEMGWLKNEMSKLEARIEQRFSSLKEEFKPAFLLEIDGVQTSFADRYGLLSAGVLEWTQKNIKNHLVDKKSIDLQHGTIGMRQCPLSVELVDEKGAADALVDAVDKASKATADGMITKIRATLEKRVKSLACWLSDLVTLKFTPNLAGIKKAIKDKRLTIKKARSLGLVITEEYDAPYATPAEVLPASDL